MLSEDHPRRLCLMLRLCGDHDHVVAGRVFEASSIVHITHLLRVLIYGFTPSLINVYTKPTRITTRLRVVCAGLQFTRFRNIGLKRKNMQPTHIAGCEYNPMRDFFGCDVLIKRIVSFVDGGCQNAALMLDHGYLSASIHVPAVLGLIPASGYIGQ
jgi:hypothetical protein